MKQSDFKKLKRSEKTKILTNETLRTIITNGHGLKVGLPEINVNIGKHKPNLRVDVLQIHKQKDELIGYEIKSCIQDFRSDNKWEQYLGLINKLYFVFDRETFETNKDEILEKLQGKAGIYLYWYSSMVYFNQDGKHYDIEQDKDIFRIMLFNYLLRTQIKTII